MQWKKGSRNLQHMVLLRDLEPGLKRSYLVLLKPLVFFLRTAPDLLNAVVSLISILVLHLRVMDTSSTFI